MCYAIVTTMNNYCDFSLLSEIVSTQRGKTLHLTEQILSRFHLIWREAKMKIADLLSLLVYSYIMYQS